MNAKEQENMRRLTENRLQNFWGYGNLKAKAWFIGMEEGLESEATLDHLAERFHIADGKASVDMRIGAENIYGHMRWFRPGAPVQPTWKYPIALLLYLKLGRVPVKEEIRDHQALLLGDMAAGESMTVELMPLPSNKAHERTWLYGGLGIPGLSTRAEYLETYKPDRVRKLRELFRQHRPSFAIFYSLTYLPEWREVIGEDLEELTKGMYFAKIGTTACCVIPQSSSFGMSYKRLYEFAEKVLPRI